MQVMIVGEGEAPTSEDSQDLVLLRIFTTVAKWAGCITYNGRDLLRKNDLSVVLRLPRMLTAVFHPSGNDDVDRRLNKPMDPRRPGPSGPPVCLRAARLQGTSSL